MRVKRSDVRVLHAEGLCTGAMADRLGCSSRTIKGHLRGMGLGEHKAQRRSPSPSRKPTIDRAKIIEMVRGGATDVEAAAAAGCSISAARYTRVNAGIEAPRWSAVANIYPADVCAMYARGMSDRLISEHLGCSASKIWKIRDEHRIAGRKPQALDKDMIRLLHSKGLSDREIADHIKAPRSTVTSTRRRIGLPTQRAALVARVSTRIRDGGTDKQIGKAEGLMPSQVAWIRARQVTA